MPICNVLIKILGPANGLTAKFIMQLDSPLPQSLRSFQIVPSNQFGVDFLGSASWTSLVDSDNPDVTHCISCQARNSHNNLLFWIFLYLPDMAGSLVVGMQGTGTSEDLTSYDWAAQTGDVTDDGLLWKVVSISGQPPPSWGSMDIFQDLPAPSGDSAVV